MNNDRMKFYSTNLSSPSVDFETALFCGLAPDKGLFMPKNIPKLSNEEIMSMKEMDYHENAFIVVKKFLGEDVDDESLRKIMKDAYDFSVPIEKVGDDHIMRLDQGPTLSFKDFAARMMARLMQYFMKKKDREITILTATSGDTGSAVAQAFFGLSNIKVVVLFPKDEVSERQRKQMTTLGGNITAIAVSGKFDDCQAIVKEAFSDVELANLNLTSANSINIGRLIPQAVYYFYAYSKVAHDDEIVFSVPSGNFGDIMGGLFAKQMGLPVKKFIAGVNENDEVPVFFQSGKYEKVVPSKNCISNAMNVGHPSNLSRIVALYGGQMDEYGNIHKMPDIDAIRRDVFSVSVSDDETRDAIKRVYDEHKVIIEPHGAVGWHALESYRKMTGDCTLAVCLETAHPAKFPLEIVKLTGVEPKVPRSLSLLEGKDEHVESLGARYSEFKSFLSATFL